MDANNKDFETEIRAIELRGKRGGKPTEEKIEEITQPVFTPGDKVTVNTYPDIFQDLSSLR